MREFLVVATVKEGGAAYPPFIVEAEDEAAAVRISQRRWLRIDRVVPYRGQPGDQKPPILQWGPPASDRTFERDYHNRAPDRDQSKEKIVAAVGQLGCVWTWSLFITGGLIGGVIGYARADKGHASSGGLFETIVGAFGGGMVGAVIGIIGMCAMFAIVRRWRS